MAVNQVVQPVIASDDANLGHTTTTSHVAGVHTVTETYTIKKLTAGGTTGSITITKGVVTAYTAPT